MISTRPQPRLRRRTVPWARNAVGLYWMLSLAFGLLRMAHEQWSAAAFQEAAQVWYVEALLFLAVWGGGSCLAGVLSRQSEPVWRARRYERFRRDPLGSPTLAGLERQRGR